MIDKLSVAPQLPIANTEHGPIYLPRYLGSFRKIGELMGNEACDLGDLKTRASLLEMRERHLDEPEIGNVEAHLSTVCSDGEKPHFVSAKYLYDRMRRVWNLAALGVSVDAEVLPTFPNWNFVYTASSLHQAYNQQVTGYNLLRERISDGLTSHPGTLTPAMISLVRQFHVLNLGFDIPVHGDYLRPQPGVRNPRNNDYYLRGLRKNLLLEYLSLPENGRIDTAFDIETGLFTVASPHFTISAPSVLPICPYQQSSAEAQFGISEQALEELIGLA